MTRCAASCVPRRKLIEHTIAEDREIVEESVRLHNEREAAEEAAQPKKAKRTRRRRR